MTQVYTNTSDDHITTPCHYIECVNIKRISDLLCIWIRILLESVHLLNIYAIPKPEQGLEIATFFGDRESEILSHSYPPRTSIWQIF